MKADRRLVEHVEHVHQARSQRGGERHAAGLAPAERAQRAVERQVAQPHQFQIRQPRLHLFEHHAADLSLPVGQPQVAEESRGVADLHGGDFAEVSAAHARRQRLGPQPRAAAGRTRPKAPPPAQEHADVHLVLPPLQPGEKTLQPAKLPLGHPVQNQLPLPCRKLAERHVQRQVVIACQRHQLLQLVGIGRRVPRCNRPVAKRFARIGNDQIHVDADDVSKTLALGTRSQRTVETVEPRLGQRILDPAILAAQLRAEPHPPPRPTVDLDEGRGERGGGRGRRNALRLRRGGGRVVLFHKRTTPPSPLGERRFQRIAEPAVAGTAGFQPIDNGVDEGRRRGGGRSGIYPRSVILGGQWVLFLA